MCHEIQENENGLRMNGAQRFWPTLMMRVKNMNITHRNIKALLEASKNVVQEVNTEKTRSMFISRHNNVRKIMLQRQLTNSGIPRNFFSGGGSTNSVEERGQRERGSGGGSPLVRGSAQFANE
jgi:hypothetical protein